MAAALGQEIPWYLLVVYAHICSAVFWTGYVLFWTIITVVFRRNLNSSESSRLLKLVSESKWPPSPIPVSYRLRLTTIGWVFFFLLLVSGILILILGGTLRQMTAGQFFAASQGRILTMKLISVAGLGICQLLSTFRSDSRIPHLSMLLTIVVVTLSVLLVH